MDAIQELENRTEESKREMDIYDALDLLQAKQRKTMNADPEEALEVIRKREREKEKEEKRKQIEDDENDEKELSELLKKKREEEDAKNEASYANLFKPKTQEVKVLPKMPTEEWAEVDEEEEDGAEEGHSRTCSILMCSLLFVIHRIVCGGRFTRYPSFNFVHWKIIARQEAGVY